MSPICSKFLNVFPSVWNKSPLLRLATFQTSSFITFPTFTATVTSLPLHFFLSHPLILPCWILFPRVSQWFSPSPLCCEVSSIRPLQSASPICVQCDFPRAVSTSQHITCFTYFFILNGPPSAIISPRWQGLLPVLHNVAPPVFTTVTDT